jgi:methylated-DNA-[protein]-cysteine S-methyltransferase
MTLREGVFQIVKKIPKGKVVSYGQIAKYLGSRAYRAVAQILKTNKFPVTTPCHRVVNSNGDIGGYFGAFQDMINVKKELLEKEGIIFVENKIPKEYFANIEDFME